MTKQWIVEMWYQGKRESVHRFTSEGEALDCYNSRVGACRFGLVGWSVSYPRRIA